MCYHCFDCKNDKIEDINIFARNKYDKISNNRFTQKYVSKTPK